MDHQVKQVLLSYQNWLKNQPKNHYEINGIIIDGIELNIPNDQDTILSFEEDASKLNVTIDYYMDEFL